ncbi:MAG: hypothetical protein ABIG30_02425 [Candidatus Aenigmatarchaeota archaeon]
MKALAPFVSHSMLIGFAAVILAIISIAFAGIHNNYSTFIAQEEMHQVCGLVRLNAGDMSSSLATYDVKTNTIVSSRDIRLPKRLGAIDYEARLEVDCLLNITSSVYALECPLNYGFACSGYTEGGNIKLTMERGADGSVFRMESEG